MCALHKHETIFQHLQQAIKRGSYKEGGKLPSEIALARKFGVSRPTVAQALRELQRLELVERHPGSGSFVKKTPLSTGTLGLLAEGLGRTEVMEPISAEIARAARLAGWDVLIGTAIADRPPDVIAREWSGRNVAGVFFAPLEHHPVRAGVNRALVERLRHQGLAVVLLDRDVEEFPARSDCDLVAMDDFFAGFDLAAHILDTGARRLVLLARPEYPATTNLRLSGARAAVERVENAKIDFVAAHPEDETRMRRMFAKTKPDAVICSNDATAAALLQTCARLGPAVVSRKMKFAGFDDVRYASLLTPPLTTMRQPCEALGVAAVETMLGRLRQPGMPARRVLLRAGLVARMSTLS